MPEIVEAQTLVERLASAASDREGYFVLLKGRLGPIAETVKESAARSHPKCTARRPRLD